MENTATSEMHQVDLSTTITSIAVTENVRLQNTSATAIASHSTATTSRSTATDIVHLQNLSNYVPQTTTSTTTTATTTATTAITTTATTAMGTTISGNIQQQNATESTSTSEPASTLYDTATTENLQSENLLTSQSTSTPATTNNNSSTTTTTTSTTTTTYPIINFEYYCPAINGSNMKVNTTDTRDTTAVHVICAPQYKLASFSGSQSDNGDFTCNGGIWLPQSPRCLQPPDTTNNGATVPIIIGCTIGGFICLLIIVGAIYLLCKLKGENKEIKEKKLEYDTKMSRIHDLIMSSFDDDVGMPAVTLDARDSDMRGVPCHRSDEFDDIIEDCAPSPEEEDTVVHLY